MRGLSTRLHVAALLGAGVQARLFAQTPPTPPDLLRAALEDLMGITTTIGSRTRTSLKTIRFTAGFDLRLR